MRMDLLSLPGTLNSLFGLTKSGERSQFCLDRLSRFDPKFHEFDPNPCTREAIPNFASSLNVHVRLRQVESQVYNRSFWIMCRSVHEHPVQTEVRSASRGLVFASVVTQVNVADMLNSAFTPGR